MNLPSVKTLKTIAGERALELRKVLEITKRSELEALLETGKYPITLDWYRQCYHPMAFGTAKLSIADEILNTHGVEYITPGSNAKSPAIEYCNTGDTYQTTLMYVSGKGYRVGCWGDIVELGNYY
jgi:hypothetical protein